MYSLLFRGRVDLRSQFIGYMAKGSWLGTRLRSKKENWRKYAQRDYHRTGRTNSEAVDTVYEIECVNSTDESYHFVGYLAYPFDRMDTVAWQVVGVPRKGGISSRGRLTWSLNYGVATANWVASEETFYTCQVVHAEPGIVYEVAMKEDTEVPVISESRRKVAPGMLWVMNDTNKPLHLGFTISDKLVVVEKVEGGETFMYKVPSTYWVVCLRNRPVKEGQVLGTSVALGPVKVQFDHGYTKCKVEAAVDDGKHILKGPDFCV